MPGLADAGFHVVAPDMRGYGRTTGGDVDYDGDLRGHYTLNVVRDALGVIWALRHREVAGVVGHDMGTFSRRLERADPSGHLSHGHAAQRAFRRPAGATPRRGGRDHCFTTAFANLRELKPPRKHYQWYNTTRSADDMMDCEQGLHDFLRAYYHCKDADFTANQPHPLADSTAEELAKLPRYYVMDLDKTMPQTVAPYTPSPAEITACRWLTEDDLDVYVTEYERTGFQGALQWYRVQVGRPDIAELQLFAGRKICLRTVNVHRRPQRLGRVSHPRRVRAHAVGLHAHGKLPVRRKRRALAPARTTGSGDRTTGGVPAEVAPNNSAAVVS